MNRAAAFALLALSSSAAGCAGPRSTREHVPPPAADAAPREAPLAAVQPDAAPAIDAAPPAAAESEVETEKDPTFSEIRDVLFLDDRGPGAACPESLPADARIRCLYDKRYAGDAKAASLAHEMLVKWRTVAGVEPARTMDGGYRGVLKLAPTVPVGADRKHLEWIVTAMRDFDAFFTELDRYGREHAAPPSSKRYRFRALRVRFMRSTNGNRPSAHAYDWTIGYNVAGSINLDADRVRETMFHEVFHLNDAARGQWSLAALGPTFDAIVKKCGVATPCLTPYSPGDTMVRGGTFYSFQPGNGVVEYAAELALRYYREQRAALRSQNLAGKPFKCGPSENARAWTLMKDEFFAGIDATPPCP